VASGEFSVWLLRERRGNAMAYVIAEPCIGVKDTACVDACPVDCIHPRKEAPGFESVDMIYIDPIECIDCGACVPVCPVSAIFALDDLPEKWAAFTEVNARYFKPDPVP
jgi:NAD-dependent dihydropyrimidine dehydrogenase PreA subunit